jgi:phosphatidylserine/phosphatidylglycerophosphate/cardiolipin synthase-like enzyme
MRNHFLPSFVAVAALFAAAVPATAQISAARTQPVGATVTVSGIVTSGAEFGSVRYLQDATAGIALYPGAAWTGFPDPQVGDSLTMTAALSEYNGLLEVGPNGITQVTVHSIGNALPTPELITPSMMNETREGELVHIEGALFTNGGQLITGNATYAFTAGGMNGVVYIRNSNPLVGTVLSAGVVNLTGIVSQFSFTGTDGYQLLPRGPQDIEATSAINLSGPVTQTNLAPTSFDLTWPTDVAGDSRVQYGLTPDLGLEVAVAESVTDHSVTLTDLTPGTIYYARVLSAVGDEETASSVRPYATVSMSPGWIRTFFTGPVDTSVATFEDAISTGTSTNDSIAAYILSAQHTLDIAVYNTNNTTITNAVNAAVANGVQVRWIAEGQNANIGLGALDPSIPVLFRTDGQGSGMHNKFIAGDAEYAETAFVLTGSTNWTTENLNTDFNNVIVLADQSLARAYVLEFEEMWGSTGPQPNSAASKFGSEKTNNTPRRFLVGGSPVELYFSPTDGTTAAIDDALRTCDYDLSFATLAFTRDDLADAIIDQVSLFIQPEGAMEEVNTTGSEFEYLLSNGVAVYSHQGISGSLHHKYGIVDHSQPLSDPLVITGSHNWSSTAETTNDENTLVVRDARVANLYFQEFTGLLNGMGVGVVEPAGREAFRFYPNPTDAAVAVEWTADGTPGHLTLFDATGRTVATYPWFGGTLRLDLGHLPAGLYLLATPDGAAGRLTVR